MNINIDWKEMVGDHYDEFWNSKKRYRVVKGSRGSKKSKTIALWIVYNMMYYWFRYHVTPNTLVIRRYMNTNWNSTRSEIIWAIDRMGMTSFWNIPKAEHTLTFLPSGGQVLFRGLDDSQSITSIVASKGYLCWVWINFIGSHILNYLNCWNAKSVI